MQSVVTIYMSGTIVSVRETIIMLVGSLSGLMCVFLASKRSSKQPLPYNKRAEETLLAWHLEGGLLSDVGVKPDDFLSLERASQCRESISTDSGSVVTSEVVKAAVHVLEDARERVEMPGKLGYKQVAGEPPFKRDVVRPSVTRQAAGAVAGCAGFATVFQLFERVDGDSMRVFGLLSLMLLVCGGVVVAAVDVDTLYLDLPAMIFMGLGSWGCGALFVINNERPRDLLMGLCVVVVWVVALETVNFIYKVLRKMDGLGFGDAVIIAATAGVPSAVIGDFMVGFFGVVCGFIIAGLVQIPVAVYKKEGARTAFALGPYLCVGWLVSWVVLNQVGLFGGVS